MQPRSASLLDRPPPSLKLYASRVLDLRQVDLELTLWLMYSNVVAPRRVANFAVHHRATKRTWARDDPGFVMVQCAMLLVAATACAIRAPGGLRRV